MNNKALNQLCFLSAKIKEFYDPTLQFLGITYTHHTRVYNDGKAFLLTNNPEYLQHFIQMQYALPSPGIYVKPGIHLWAGITSLQNFDTQVVDMRRHFNIDHQIAIVYTHEAYVDIFCLATTTNRPEMINNYLNNRDNFDNVFLSYQDKFKHDINLLDQNPFDFPLRPKEFIKKRELDNTFYNLSKREFECLDLLAQGQTAKHIARELLISPRTVERHIDNIREKTRLKLKAEILNKYREFKQHEKA